MADGNDAQQETATFEERLRQLESVVAEMEGGALGLDEMMKHFEAGMKLASECEKRLGHTRRRVEMLMNQDPSNPEWAPLESEEPQPASDS